MSVSGERQNHAQSYDSRPWLQHYSPGVGDLAAPLFHTLPHLLASSCERYGGKTISVCLPNGLSRALTYRDVDRLSDDFAAYLRFNLGLRKGDRVALQMPNCLAFPVALFGILKAGGIVVNTNPLYTSEEMLSQFRDSGARVLVILDMFADKLGRVGEAGVERVITVSLFEFFPTLKRALLSTVMRLKKMLPPAPIEVTPFRDTLHHGAAHGTRGSLDADGVWTIPSKDRNSAERVTDKDIAVLQYTGGTTGRAKGAVLTHANLLWGVSEFIELAKGVIVPGKGVAVAAIPLYHIFAFQERLLAQLYYGSEIVLIPSPRPISNLRKAFEKWQVTSVAGVNTLFNALLQEPWFRENPPRSINLSIGGGSAVVSETATEWEKVTGCTIVEGYGMSETSSLICVNPLDGSGRIGYVGLPAPNTYIRCIDPLWNVVPPGETGELVVKGPQVMHEYWNQPKETALVLRDGWLATGDIAIMEPDGYVKLVDRKKDMIIVSGFKVFPNEVEDVLMRSGRVIEAAVIGVPDPKSGEAVKAFVVPSSPDVTPEQITAFAREHLTAYKVPKVIEFRQDLPKTPVGKILRKELRPEKNSAS